jgi:hypothetical protein
MEGKLGREMETYRRAGMAGRKFKVGGCRHKMMPNA